MTKRVSVSSLVVGYAKDLGHSLAAAERSIKNASLAENESNFKYHCAEAKRHLRAAVREIEHLEVTAFDGDT